MADTAASKAAATAGRRVPAVGGVPAKPARTKRRREPTPVGPRHGTPQPATATPRPGEPQARGPRQGTPQPITTAPAARGSSTRGSGQHSSAAAQHAAAAATFATGPYADSLNALTTEEQQTRDLERRRMSDNQAYQAWLQGNNVKQAAALQQSDADRVARGQRIQAATAAAQQQTQQTLDAQRAGRAGTVTAGPGNSRARLAGDDTLTQSLLASEQQLGATTAQSSAQKQGFLAAATASAGLADAARIRGETGQALQDIGRRRGELLVHKEDTLSAERASIAQAKADAATAQHSEDVRLAIAEATIGQRASDNAASRELAAREGSAGRELTAHEGRAGRAARLKAARISAASRKDAGGHNTTSDSERRARADDVRALDSSVAAALSIAQALRKSGTKDPAIIRAGIQQQIPGVSPEAVNNAIDSVFAGTGGVDATRVARNRRKLARARRRLQQGR